MTAKNKTRTSIVITMGDPCGVGPEIVIRALERMALSEASLVVAGDPGVLMAAAARFAGPRFKKSLAKAPWFSKPEEIPEYPEPALALLAASNLSMDSIKPGRPGKAQGRAAWNYLEAALSLMLSGRCQALVTAPVSKHALSLAGFPHPGHTDWLADKTGADAVMMLAAGGFRVVPATVHVPLIKVAKELRADRLQKTIEVTAAELKDKFRIKHPRVGVCGLNPHAGEQGLLGKEEESIIAPAIKAARARGVDVFGPRPADTMFTASARRTYDAVVCMYHDQAMIPIKTIGMNRAVNVTLGLPIIRTSPAHGTAPEIAWRGIADPAGMIAAVKLALKMASTRR